MALVNKVADGYSYFVYYYHFVLPFVASWKTLIITEEAGLSSIPVLPMIAIDATLAGIH